MTLQRYDHTAAWTALGETSSSDGRTLDLLDASAPNADDVDAWVWEKFIGEAPIAIVSDHTQEAISKKWPTKDLCSR